MTHTSAPDLDEGPPIDAPNLLHQSQMMRWTLRCPHCRHHQSPDQFRHPVILMKSGRLVFRSTMHEAG